MGCDNFGHCTQGQNPSAAAPKAPVAVMDPWQKHVLQEDLWASFLLQKCHYSQTSKLYYDVLLTMTLNMSAMFTADMAGNLTQPVAVIAHQFEQ